MPKFYIGIGLRDKPQIVPFVAASLERLCENAVFERRSFHGVGAYQPRLIEFLMGLVSPISALIPLRQENPGLRNFHTIS
jgi:hypothetical protein